MDIIQRTGLSNDQRLEELDECTEQYHACRLARNGQTTAASTSVPRSMSEEEPSMNIKTAETMECSCGNKSNIKSE